MSSPHVISPLGSFLQFSKVYQSFSPRLGFISCRLARPLTSFLFLSFFSPLFFHLCLTHLASVLLGGSRRSTRNLEQKHEGERLVGSACRLLPFITYRPQDELLDSSTSSDPNHYYFILQQNKRRSVRATKRSHYFPNSWRKQSWFLHTWPQ